MSALHLKHSSFLPFADVKPVTNNLVHAMPWQCMLALPICILQTLTFVLIDHVEKKQLWKQLKKMTTHHRHLSNIDCFMAHTACLVCFISTVNGRSKKGKIPWKMWR